MSSRFSRRQLLQSSAALPIAMAVGATLSTSVIAKEIKQSTSPYGIEISAKFPFKKKTANIDGSTMSYIDEGEGQPVVFLHGNPTSSYLWRNIIPYVSGNYRAIAPDLIGMGDSGKPEIDYTFLDHADYLEKLIAHLGLKNIILVVHDWGSALGMRYARLNPDNVAALAFLEAIVAPAMPVKSFEAMPKQLAEFFSLMRTDKGAELILGQNYFVEFVLPKMGVMRPMSETEMSYYRAPFPTPESRLPTLQWPREVPIGGDPADATLEVTKNGKWFYETEIPKLMFYARPGAIAPQQVVDYMTANLKNLETRFLGAGLHFLQEEHPHEIGAGLADWLRRL